MRKNMRAYFAAYDVNDTFLDVGTCEEIACRFDLTPNQVRQRAKDNKRKTYKKNRKDTIKIYGLGVMPIDE